MTELPVQLDPARVPSPCYVVDTQALEKNLEVLSYVQQESGAKILLALKAFAMHALFPRIRRHLAGICASGPWEAQLGREEFCLDGHEVHTFSPAYSQQDMQVALRLSDHVVCNSWQQWQMLRELAQQNPEIAGQVDFGIRVNPEHSEGQVPLYDPCAPYSRLGITEGGLRRALKQDAAGLDGLSGLHFHTLCEQGADALQRTLVAVEERFGDIIEGMQWLNLGGGHHITRPGYDLDLLIDLVRGLRQRYKVQVYLEPGEAIAINTGVLICTVLDIVDNGMPIAVLDISATAHMPDVLEMPYRPEVRDASEAGVLPHTYRLAGVSCLAGDVIGDYSFQQPLQSGDRLIFEDMSHYTMVKTTMFNGVRHPSIAWYDPSIDHLEIVREFSYQDFRDRLS